jgi:hypothetical protein
VQAEFYESVVKRRQVEMLRSIYVQQVLICFVSNGPTDVFMTDSLDTGIGALTTSGTIMLKQLQQQHEMQMMIMQQQQAHEMQMQQQYIVSQSFQPTQPSPVPVHFISPKSPMSPQFVPVTPVSPASSSVSSPPMTPHTPMATTTATPTEATQIIEQVQEAYTAQNQRLDRVRQQQKQLMDQMQAQLAQDQLEQLHGVFNQLGPSFQIDPLQKMPYIDLTICKSHRWGTKAD